MKLEREEYDLILRKVSHQDGYELTEAPHVASS